MKALSIAFCLALFFAASAHAEERPDSQPQPALLSSDDEGFLNASVFGDSGAEAKAQPRAEQPLVVQLSDYRATDTSPIIIRPVDERRVFTAKDDAPARPPRTQMEMKAYRDRFVDRVADSIAPGFGRIEHKSASYNSRFDYIWAKRCGVKGFGVCLQVKF